MRRLFSNDRGITLVEVVAVVAIGSIIILFITNLFFLIQNQYEEQSAHSEQVVDVTLATKAITKKIRSGEEITDIGSGYDSIQFADHTKYHFDDLNQVIYVNGSPFVYQIYEFFVELTTDTYDHAVVKLKINGVETEIVLRESG